VSYRCEKFGQALLEMASTEGTVKERLIEGVVAGNILFLRQHFDDDLEEEYTELVEKLTREGNLADSIREMDDLEVFSTIDKILSIYHDLGRRNE
jgi:hypothetical protein